MDLLLIARIGAIFGLILLVIASIYTVAGQMNFPLGNLPNNFIIKCEYFSYVTPLVTSLIISILITIRLNILLNLSRKYRVLLF